jgi:phosphoribosylanthranilate isomerase
MTRPRIKICGVTRAADAQLAVQLGADAIGFVVWEGSPRAVRARVAALIGEQLPPYVTRVGVVVNMSPSEVSTLARVGRFDAIQLHGDEDLDRFAALEPRLVRSVALETAEDVQRALDLPPAVTVIVDAADRQKKGGTGQRANWALAAELACARPVILAGGLTPSNVRAAVEQVKPWAVDVSSGVEASPGVKDPRLLEKFFRAVNGDPLAAD